MSAEAIHNTGLEQNARIGARMDALLKKQGLSKGSVGARMDALSRDRRFVFPETEAGHGQIVSYLNELIAQTRKRMPQLSALKLKAPVVVKRVPPDIQDGRRRQGREVAVDDPRRNEPDRLATAEGEQALELPVLALGQRSLRGLEPGLLQLSTESQVLVPETPVPGEPRPDLGQGEQQHVAREPGDRLLTPGRKAEQDQRDRHQGQGDDLGVACLTDRGHPGPPGLKRVR